MPDARLLVVQLSDLPIGYNLVPAETFPIPLSKVLSDPWSASSSPIVRRERLSGYQIGFSTPEAERIECSAAVYRSTSAARAVYRLRTRSAAAFLAELGGRSLPAANIGEETDVVRFDIRGSQHLGVAWRFRNVLASCVTAGLSPPDEAQMVRVARMQQQRIGTTLPVGKPRLAAR